jgi:hypothetical protein
MHPTVTGLATKRAPTDPPTPNPTYRDRPAGDFAPPPPAARATSRGKGRGDLERQPGREQRDEEDPR